MKRFLLALVFSLFIFNFQSDAAMTVKLNNAPLQFSISDPRVIWLFNRGEEIDVGGLSNNFYSVTYKGQKGYLHKNYLF